MRIWIPIAFVAVVVLAYALFLVLDSLEGQGANAFGLANTIGLITVVVGVLVAGTIMRRTTRP